MQCEQFEARWQQLLDERLPWDSDPHLVAHTLGCERCALQAAAGERLLLGLDVGELPPLSEDFAERVVAAAGPLEPPARRWGAAASVVVLLAASLLLMFSLLPGPAPPQLRGASAATAATEKNDGPETLPQLASPGVQELVFKLAERFPRDEAARVLQRLDDQVARPITNSFGTAFTAIYQTIPVPSRPAKSASLTVPAAALLA